jgi:hypothetical protein
MFSVFGGRTMQLSTSKVCCRSQSLQENTLFPLYTHCNPVSESLGNPDTFCYVSLFIRFWLEFSSLLLGALFLILLGLDIFRDSFLHHINLEFVHRNTSSIVNVSNVLLLRPDRSLLDIPVP